MSNRSGYRGDIGSRPYFGERAAQHVQNLVIRDYCQRNGHPYLLSATEYAMNGCYMMLEEVFRELPRLEGIVLYSIFMLPRNRDRRRRAYDTVLSSGAVMAGALENLVIRNEQDIRVVEDIWAIKLLTGTRTDRIVV
jgi:sporadic carbohydrate cluster protein (TIGR04323 family)